jgi:hypothetical protein
LVPSKSPAATTPLPTGLTDRTLIGTIGFGVLVAATVGSALGAAAVGSG